MDLLFPHKVSHTIDGLLVPLFKIKSFASTFILAADCKLMFPLIVFVPDTLLIAPSELTPPPLILIVASDTVIPFCNCKAAFLLA